MCLQLSCIGKDEEEFTMKKSIALIAAGLMMASVMTGCNSTPANNNETGNNGEAVFKIGGIGPLTGAAASYGNSVKQGAEIAIKEINEAGGVKVGDTTYMFDMTFADDEATEDKAIQAYNSIMDEQVNAIMGCVTSGACVAIVDMTKEDGILQITPSGSADGCIKNDNAFRICFSDAEQGTAMADYAKDKLGYSKIAILYNNSSDYSIGLRDAFSTEFAAKGGKVVATEAFADGDVDFNTQLTKIKSAGADAIYVPAYYQEATYITKQAAAMGLTLPFLGSDGWDGVLGTVTDASTVEGAIFSSPFCASVDDEKVVKFVEAYKAAYKGAIPDQFAADAYDCVYTFKAAMEKAGSIESADMIAAMTQITVAGLTGDAITFDASGVPTKDVRYVTIKDGAYGYAE